MANRSVSDQDEDMEIYRQASERLTDAVNPDSSRRDGVRITIAKSPGDSPKLIDAAQKLVIKLLPPGVTARVDGGIVVMSRSAYETLKTGLEWGLPKDLPALTR